MSTVGQVAVTSEHNKTSLGLLNRGDDVCRIMQGKLPFSEWKRFPRLVYVLHDNFILVVAHGMYVHISAKFAICLPWPDRSGMIFSRQSCKGQTIVDMFMTINVTIPSSLWYVDIPGLVARVSMFDDGFL